jgi:YfiH family protein
MRPDVTCCAEVLRNAGAYGRYELTEWHRDLGLLAGIAPGGGRIDFGLGGDGPAGQALASWLGLLGSTVGFDSAVVARQVHGSAIAVYRNEVPDGLLIRDGVDGHVTDTPGLLLAVTVADCVPVFLAHPPTGRIGLLHAGWRGIVAGVLEAGIQALTGNTVAAANDVVMHCGIAICGSCYEVGPEVITAVTGRPAERPEPLDLRAVLIERATTLGVHRITTSPFCTAHDAGFASYRAQHSVAGRMAAFLGRPPA